MKQATGRHELKHYINQGDLIQLQARLPPFTTPDEHAIDGSYRVRSLYFDNYRDRALQEKLDGVDEREKFRLRFYNDDLTFIRLEKKSKRKGISFKTSCAISALQCQEILDGNWRSLRDSMEPLLIELYTKMQIQHLRPKSIVDYKREAYVYPMGNVRITIDTDLHAGGRLDDFLNPHAPGIPMPNLRILEVKYDAFLPELIRGLVALPDRRASAFSKYAVTRII